MSTPPPAPSTSSDDLPELRLKPREERRIAAELLGQVALAAPAETLALLDTWAPQIESGDTADVLAELDRRDGTSGIAEKAGR